MLVCYPTIVSKPQEMAKIFKSNTDVGSKNYTTEKAGQVKEAAKKTSVVL